MPIPSRPTVARRVEQMKQDAAVNIKKALEGTRPALTTDIWTANDGVSLSVLFQGCLQTVTFVFVTVSVLLSFVSLFLYAYPLQLFALCYFPWYFQSLLQFIFHFLCDLGFYYRLVASLCSPVACGHGTCTSLDLTNQYIMWMCWMLQKWKNGFK